MDIPQTTLEAIAKYSEQTGRRGATALAVLTNLEKQLDILLCNEAAIEIMKMDVNRIEDLLVKVYREQATDSEKAELRYLRDNRMPMVISKLKKYIEISEQVNKKLGKVA